MAVVTNSRRSNVLGTKREITFTITFTDTDDTVFATGLSRVDFAVLTSISSATGDNALSISRNSNIDTAEGNNSPGSITVNGQTDAGYTLRVLGV